VCSACFELVAKYDDIGGVVCLIRPRQGDHRRGLGREDLLLELLLLVLSWLLWIGGCCSLLFLALLLFTRFMLSVMLLLLELVLQLRMWGQLLQLGVYFIASVI
jgi:hypothetical protein